MDGSDQTQRLDKWLWAARFFKTRSAASTAVNGGKITVDGVKPKPARALRIGALLHIERGAHQFEVVVKELCEQRRGFPQASAMYEETPQSVARRQLESTRRELAQRRRQQALGRPNSRERQTLRRLKTQAGNDE